MNPYLALLPSLLFAAFSAICGYGSLWLDERDSANGKTKQPDHATRIDPHPPVPVSR
jgi:hypothetical protein